MKWRTAEWVFGALLERRAMLGFHSGRIAVAGLGALALVTAGVLPAVAGRPHPAAKPAAGFSQPPEGTLVLPSQPGENVIHYAGVVPFNNQEDGLAFGQLGLNDPSNSCSPDSVSPGLNDQHFFKIVVPATINPAYDYLIRFQINWTPAAAETAADMQLYIYGPDRQLIDVSDGSQDSEGVNLTSAVPGTYDVLACQFLGPPSGQPYTGTLTARTTVPPVFPAATGVTPPGYGEFDAPPGVADSAAEPSIGNNWKSGHTLFTSNTSTFDVAFNDPAVTSTWTAVNTAPNTSNQISLDPIGFTDSVTGRSFTSQLLAVCSGAVFTDDDYKTTTPSEGCGTGLNGGDHETVGGGPFPAGLGPLPGSSYPDAVYYCAQTPLLLIGTGATCARSDTGGLTFGPVVSIFGNNCNGIHGHLRVAPDGTAYVPDNNCDGTQAVIASTDGGATWSVRKIPDSVAGTSDPSVAAGRDGTLYFGYADGTGKPRISVSRDRGATWSPSVDVGIPVGVHNAEFSEVIAGDGDRAAFAFLGTSTRGAYQSAGFGQSADGKTYTGGSWDLYVATTYDRGAHWTTVDATPGNPVQRGCIWNNGGSNPCRNLLDFNDITVTKTGRVLVGFAKGCLGACVGSTSVKDNGLAGHGSIVRQLSGLGLFAASDPAAPPVVVPPPVQGPSQHQGPTGPGSLATTGGNPLLAGLAAGLVVVVLAVRRRRATR